MSADDRREVIRLISEWNSSRYDLFALSQPNEKLEFHGVMRFYFQDAGEKVSTKCVRVDSTASTDDVIQVLIEKFRPDMKSLSSAKDYAIYEVHADADERRLGADERPLWVQLEWGKDGREGRFLLKNEHAKTVKFDTTGDGLSLLRDKKRMSKREKKKHLKLQQQQQQQLQQHQQHNGGSKENEAGKTTVSKGSDLYKEVPDSSFTRSISNPEIVMARRRQQKLENKLKQIKYKDGGGTLKVFGETLKPDIPYKTLLMTNQDTAAFAVKETLDKYGLSAEDPDNYCLVQVVTPSREERDKHGAQIKEYILEDTACPLAILIKYPPTSGSIIFQIRRCTPDILALRKQKRKLEQQQQQQQQQQLLKEKQLNGHSIQQQQQQQQQPKQFDMFQGNKASPAYQSQRVTSSHHQQHVAKMQQQQQQQQQRQQQFPFLVELSPDGYEIHSPRVLSLSSDFYELGNDAKAAATAHANFLRVERPGVLGKHCAIKKSNDQTQLLLVPFADTYVNGALIDGPVQLADGDTLRLGHHALYRVYNPNQQRSVTAAHHQPKQQQQQQQQIHNANSTSNYGMLYEDGGGSGMPSAAAVADVVCAPVPAPVALVQQQQQQQQQQQPAPSTRSGVASGSGGDGLPGLIEFSAEAESTLLAAICNNQASDQPTTGSGNPAATHWQFRLAPVYTMYMMLRYRLSQKYTGGRTGSQLSFNDKLHALAPLIHKMVNCMREAVDANHLEKHVLPYWLANTAELLYFLKQDVHLAQVSFDAQELLADTVQLTFKYLAAIMQHQLDQVLVAFFDPSDHIEEVSDAKLNGQVTQDSVDALSSNMTLTHARPTLKHVVGVLNETMQLLRGSRVNAALTIQLFSQLFHFISASLFNRLARDDQRSGWCSRYWGDKLTRRLAKLQTWAERQGLELAADCHLSRVVQAAYLLAAAKHDHAELSTISSNCFALNSPQIKRLLANYVLAPGEPPLSAALCANLIAIAQNTADEVAKQEGRPLSVEEELDLQLPFLLPEDGHSCEFIKGLPVGLLEFLESLQNAGLCWLWQNTHGPGSWKKFMIVDAEQQQQQQVEDNNVATTTATTTTTAAITAPVGVGVEAVKSPRHPQQQEFFPIEQQQQQVMSDEGPLVVKLQLAKKNNGLGLSIIAARGPHQTDTGIYVKSVVSGGAADDDGRLNAGDQLLAVDEASLINVSQERAAELMTRSGPRVTLTVAKDAAAYYQLDALLSNKSPEPPLPASSLQQQQMTAEHFQAYSNVDHVQQQQQQFVQPQPQQQYRMRSMSQEILGSVEPSSSNIATVNQQQQQQQATTMMKPSVASRRSPAKSALKPPQLQLQQQQVQQQQQHQPSATILPATAAPATVVRSLPNEQQVRYGSERPASMHFTHQQFNTNNNINNHQQQQQQYNNGGYGKQTSSSAVAAHTHTYQPQQPQAQQHMRTLHHNEMRFGSERPSTSSYAHHLSTSTPSVNNLIFNNNSNNANNRFAAPGNQRIGTDAISSPIKQQPAQQQQQPYQQQQQQQPQPQEWKRQASISELDEINYHQQQQQQQQQQPFEDLYGKVNNAKPSTAATATAYTRSATTMTSAQRGGFELEQQTRIAESSSSSSSSAASEFHNQQQLQQLQQQQQQQQQQSKSYLYEQIWSTNPNHQPQQQQHQQYQPSDVDNALKKLHIAHPPPPPHLQHQAASRKYSDQADNGRAASASSLHDTHTNHQAKPMTTRAGLNGNYENQVVQQQQQQQPTSRGVYTKPPPLVSASQLASQQAKMASANQQQQQQQQNSWSNQPSTTHVTNALMNKAPATWEQEQLARRRQDTEHRLSMLQQRIAMLDELEAKSERSNDDEIRASKLRTEIEFDKRVLQHNHQLAASASGMGINGRAVEVVDETLDESTVHDDDDNDDDDDYVSPAVAASLNGRHSSSAGGVILIDHSQQQQQQQQQHKQQQQQQQQPQSTNGEIKREEFRLKKTQQQQQQPQPAPQQIELPVQYKPAAPVAFEAPIQQKYSWSASSSSVNNNNNNQNYPYQIGISASSNRTEIEVVHVSVQSPPTKQPVQANGGAATSSSSSSLSSSKSASMVALQQPSTNNNNKHVQFAAIPSQTLMSPPPPPLAVVESQQSQQLAASVSLGKQSHLASSSGLFKSSTTSSSDELNSSQSSQSSPTPTQHQFAVPPPLPTQPAPLVNMVPVHVTNKRVMFNEQSTANNYSRSASSSVIGANEIYVDKRLKQKQLEQQEQHAANMFVEGEKLSFKDKMKLFAQQSNAGGDIEQRLKVSRKQREIESKFDMR